MVVFFTTPNGIAYAVDTDHCFSDSENERLRWLFSGALPLGQGVALSGTFVGPRKEMITPWSTNAVEITQNMGLDGISRIEMFIPVDSDKNFDPMLQAIYSNPGADVFNIDTAPAPQEFISDIAEYNAREGLALSKEEEEYLAELSKRLGRPLTDSEVFGFSQVNSEHCRHKIFNGTFIIDGEEKPSTLFKLIKRTSQVNPGKLVSAYKDNVAFVEGPAVMQFAPERGDEPAFFSERKIDTVLSLKAETHNFPTTVEPFNGAATGSGGEIRDRLGGGRASLPLAGTAVYMTSYPRIEKVSRRWENAIPERKWLYQSPADILIKASNGASDFGNKFGQPLICGSLLTFEHKEDNRIYGFDKVIMLAGGVGYATADQALKGQPEAGQSVVLAGGDNYRIGMGGGAVSSVDTGRYAGAIELNAVQRANPEMQKRVANLIRSLAESKENPIVSIHDHGAGGHLNALSELIESTGGNIDIDALPVGDPTLSDKEIIGNESQERMGFIVNEKDIPLIERIASRERAPLYIVGQTTNDHRLLFRRKKGQAAIDLAVEDMLGNPPKTVITDSTVTPHFAQAEYDSNNIGEYIDAVLSLDAVACKDWLTNKVDRSVTGHVARQQCQGQLQLPLSDFGAVALDYHGKEGIATSIGHAPQIALTNPEAASRLAIAEALTNLVGAVTPKSLNAVSLSANWMWPCKNPGEDAALYRAVEACSDFACALGCNIPTGKDSLSMTQKYPDGSKVTAPGTVIISASAPVHDIRMCVGPVINPSLNSTLYYIDFCNTPLALGGSALAQSLGKMGGDAPDVKNASYFRKAYACVSEICRQGLAEALHDVSAGGLITALLEMCFANTNGGLNFYTDNFNAFGESDLVKILFAENPAVVVQVTDKNERKFVKAINAARLRCIAIAATSKENTITISHNGNCAYSAEIPALRRRWYEPSYHFDCIQTAKDCADSRFENFDCQPVKYRLPASFDGTFKSLGITPRRRKASGTRAAIIREKGVNGDREMAYSLHLAGFDVKDVHMTDLMSGREMLDDINMIVFCGGFSNSDVLGSAKGWASGFRWNDTARNTLKRFYDRPDTLSLGVCNGCQLMVELDLLGAGTNDKGEKHVEMCHNRSGKFESTFLSVKVPQNNSVMFGNLSGMKAGIWVAHGEGRFHFSNGLKASGLQVVGKYAYSSYPGNPNGSEHDIAALASADGRHLAIMPHLERAIFPWQWAYYPHQRSNDEVAVWIKAFVNARRWIEKATKA
ncbi:MAG: phosphoribosylformylglycinamidine synthase [Muribaculaceae bacterium]|nr:phosphoribosylformylglycinamidine synthase [Muribaculaceae bacterium]